MKIMLPQTCAIEISEVEEQLNSPLESLSEAAAFARPKDKQSSAKSLSSNPDGDEDEDADEFRIDDAQLSGGQLAQHFLVADEDESEEGSDLPAASKMEVSQSTEDDDFDISLPLEQRKPVHSLHEDEESVDQSLSNQSTTDDVSELVEEPVLEKEDKTEESEAISASAPQETQVDESQITEEQDHSMEEIVATNESIEVTYEAEETANTSHKQDLITDLDEEQEDRVEEVIRPTSTVETLKLPPLQEPQIMERKRATALQTLRLGQRKIKTCSCFHLLFKQILMFYDSEGGKML